MAIDGRQFDESETLDRAISDGPFDPHLDPDLVAVVARLRQLHRPLDPLPLNADRIWSTILGGAPPEPKRPTQNPIGLPVSWRPPANEPVQSGRVWRPAAVPAWLAMATIVLLTTASAAISMVVLGLTPVPRLEAVSGVVVEVVIDATVDDVPAGEAQVWVERWRFLTTDAGFAQDPLGEPQVLAVESGELAAVIGGVDRRLAAGDRLVVPAWQTVTARNVGPGEAVMFLITVPSVTFVVPDWDVVDIIGEEAIPPFSAELPGGTTRMLLERLTMPPGSILPQEVAPEVGRIGVATGTLGVTVVGEDLPARWQSGVERRFGVGSSVSVVRPGTPMALRNAGSTTLVLYRLTISPVGEGSVVRASP